MTNFFKIDMKSTQMVKIWHGNGKNHVRSMEHLGYI